MTERTRTLRPPRGLIAAVLAVLALLLTMSGFASATSSATEPGSKSTSGPKPTIVLVHGAFADASGWGDVVTKLQNRGYTVYAPANPLRGVTADANYLKTFLATISGPVVLVGHSYGGVTITNAATGNPNVKSLVYIAAFAPIEGENVQQMSTLAGGSNDLLSHIVLRPFGPGPADQDAYIDPVFFHQTFAQDLPRKQTAVMAASQRPAALATLAEPSGPPGWQDIPSWYLVAQNDNTIPPVSERFMADRMGAHTTEIRSSHVAMMSHPNTVTDLILQAAH